jgi:sugar/nucleoside kinase (ribokinase family)
MPSRSRPRRPPSFVVLGDLMLDVVVVPGRPIVPATDVPGMVRLRQGGSAATTARWMARLGASTQLVTAVGRDPAGRALVESIKSDGVRVHAVRVTGRSTGRVAVLVAPGGERSFIADRGAADALAAADLRPDWFREADLLHLPVYSLLGKPLGDAGRAAVNLVRQASGRPGGLLRGQVSVDLASSGPLLGGGPEAAQALIAGIAPDLLFATAAEAEGLLAGGPLDDLLELAPVVVVKRGAAGATVLARVAGDAAGAAGQAGHDLRFEVATRPISAADTTGAGDAFDAGFLVAWLEAGAAGRSTPAALQRATAAGHRAAARHIAAARPELALR